MRREEEFTAYVSARWGSLVRSAVLLGCRPADAEDLVQTVLARCFVAWPSVQSASNRDAYVYRVLVNAHVDSRRRRWWGERPSARLPERSTSGDPLSAVDTEDAVGRALGNLSAPHRAVIVLRFYAHLSEQDTAEALGVAVGTVKSRTSRALTLLAASPHLIEINDGNQP